MIGNENEPKAVRLAKIYGGKKSPKKDRSRSRSKSSKSSKSNKKNRIRKLLELSDQMNHKEKIVKELGLASNKHSAVRLKMDRAKSCR